MSAALKWQKCIQPTFFINFKAVHDFHNLAKALQNFIKFKSFWDFREIFVSYANHIFLCMDREKALL